jgi:hypothetical protein
MAEMLPLQVVKLFHFYSHLTFLVNNVEISFII